MSKAMKLEYLKFFYFKQSILFLLLATVCFPITTKGEVETLNWSVGLHCKSNLPDPRLDSFFIVEEKKQFIS